MENIFQTLLKNVEESPEQHAEWKRLDANLLYESIYVMFKDRHKLIYGGRSGQNADYLRTREDTVCWKKGMREFLGMIEIFYILVWVVVT